MFMNSIKTEVHNINTAKLCDTPLDRYVCVITITFMLLHCKICKRAYKIPLYKSLKDINVILMMTFYK